jgi:hypothetical protein
MHARHQPRPERLGIAQIAQHVHDAFEPGRHRQAARLAPCHQQAPGVGQPAAVIEPHRPLPAIDRGCPRLRAEIDAGRAHGLARDEGERIDGALAHQEPLGQGRALIEGAERSLPSSTIAPAWPASRSVRAARPPAWPAPTTIIAGSPAVTGPLSPGVSRHEPGS